MGGRQEHKAVVEKEAHRGRVSGKNVVAVCSGWQRLQSRIVDPKIMELLDRGRVTMETWELEFHCVVEIQTRAWVVDR